MVRFLNIVGREGVLLGVLFLLFQASYNELLEDVLAEDEDFDDVDDFLASSTSSSYKENLLFLLFVI